MATRSFSTWGGPDGIEQFIMNETGCKPYSGAGINPRPANKTTLLRSVDGTEYYDDDLNDVENPKYTLFGHDGDQSASEKRFNEPLLNTAKTQHIFLYRVIPVKNAREYIWYGKYTIVGRMTKVHPGKNGIPREIIVLSLKKV